MTQYKSIHTPTHIHSLHCIFTFTGHIIENNKTQNKHKTHVNDMSTALAWLLVAEPPPGIERFMVAKPP